jgi:hypothetical protein
MADMTGWEHWWCANCATANGPISNGFCDICAEHDETPREVVQLIPVPHIAGEPPPSASPTSVEYVPMKYLLAEQERVRVFKRALMAACRDWIRSDKLGEDIAEAYIAAAKDHDGS